MITKCRTAIILGALAAFIVCGTVQASTILPGGGDPFTLHFDENGNAVINYGGGNMSDPGFIALDPNTGILALTYQFSENINPGIVDIFSPSGHLSDALSFYNIGANGFMAYYSTLPGTDLADTVSGGFVPLGFFASTEVGDTFTWFPGGNSYYGISPDSGGRVPDGGSTLGLLSGAFALVGALRRKLRK